VRVRWTDPALDDLEYAQAWIAQDRPMAALDQVRKILQASKGLRDFPNLGRSGRRRGTRELVVPGSPFIVAYKVRGEVIEILRVFHGSRRWPDGL
jgi:toxin ParE1/3/4